MARKRSATFGIEPPQLPKSLPVATPSQHFVDQASYTECSLLDCDWSAANATDMLLDRVSGQNINLHTARLKLAQLLDVRFERGDWSGSVWEKAHVQRGEWLHCRMVGVHWNEANFENVLWQQCNGELARFWSATFKATRFDHCVLREASFEGCNLAGVVFRQCDLSNADFRGTKLHGADFRSSIISGMQVGIKELQGAIIAPQQAVQLASLLGGVVKDEDDSD